ncbi:E-selectin-like isoform X2 [Lithobates pipiens]
MGPAETDIRSAASEKWKVLKILVFAVLICEVSAWTYHHDNSTMTWEKAREWCEMRNSKMVFIRNKIENKHLNETLPGRNPYYWIGIRKFKGNWTWVENQKSVPEEVKAWAPKEPTASIHELCVELYINRTNDSGMWNNERCDKSKMPLCYQASCRNSTCHHGECIETIGNYTCECWPGFHGNNCEHAVSCIDLQIPANVKINCTHGYGKSQYKSFCNFSCDEGYELNGSRSVFCQKTGEWSDFTPTCLAVSCKDLQIPANVKMNCPEEYGKSQYKSFCNFSCDEGYELNGSRSVFCQKTGEWSDFTPTCLAVSCKDLQIPANVKMNCPEEYGKSQYKSFCNFSCDEGYELNGSRSVFCQKTGEWSDFTPTCLAVSCKDLQIPANVKMNCPEEYGKSQYKSFCNFSCDEGYELNGSRSVFCQKTGEWSDSTPTCLVVSCIDLQIPANGNISCTGENGKSQYKSFCNFSCDEGYELNGTRSVFCQKTGEWSESTPTCLAWNGSSGKQKEVAIVSSVSGTVGLLLSGIPFAYLLSYLRKKKKENPHILKTNKEPVNTFENPAFEDTEINSLDL